jgi:hypothetical protein
MSNLRLSFKEWLHQLWDAAVQGGANAALAAMGLAGANSLGVAVQPLDYKQTGAIFVAGGVVKILEFLRTKPSPDLDSSEDGSNTESTTTGKQ